MGAILSGCFTFLGLLFLLGFCIQYPAIFWGLVAVFVTVIVLGVREGLRRKREAQASGLGPRQPQANSDSDEEGDIRHHYGFDGMPHSISNPETIQNESIEFGDDERHN